LLHIARLADEVPVAASLGLAAPGRGLDLDAANRFRDGVVDRLHLGLRRLLGSSGVEIVAGRGRLVGPGRVEVEGAATIAADHVVIATGSSVKPLPALPIDGEMVMNSDDALRVTRIPGRAVVVGAGAVGVELASLWRSLGSDVVLVEAADRILPLEDADSSAFLARAFQRRGIDVRTGVSVVGLAGVTLELSDGTAIKTDQVLVAVGRRPATADVGLAELDLLDDRGFVKVDAFGRTALDSVWAVGDVVPTLALAHAAFAEGFVVADAIAGHDPEPVDHVQVPRVTYCRPEVASVGLTESEARLTFGDVSTTVTTLAGNARALIEGESGQTKVITGPDGTMLGVHIVGPAATELIGEAALATGWGALAAEVGAVAHAHPTLYEVIGETALAAAGIGIPWPRAT
jgi:dihydrolipoamide dehydrogenase